MWANYDKHLGYAFVVIATLFSLLTVCSVCYLAPFDHSRSIALIFFILSLLTPNFSFLALLVLLPVFGNKPGSVQATYLIFLNSLWIMALVARHYRSIPRISSWSFTGKSPLITLVVLYVLASWLSLSSLPGALLFSELRGAFPDFALPTMAIGWWNFLRTTENIAWFPCLSAFLTTQAVSNLLLVVFLQQRKASKNFVRFALIAISLGLVSSLIAGLLDYYNLLDLKIIRNLDPFVNPGNVQFRLQSFFGHSGWYAEYVVLGSATLASLMFLPFKAVYNKALILAILLLAQFVLILTYQRGSWLTFPLVLLLLVGGLAGESKRQLIKSVLLLAVLVSLPIVTIYFILQSPTIRPDHRVDFSSYALRFQEINNSSDRTQFMRSALWLTSERPFYGHGADSYAYQFYNHFSRKSSPYYKHFDLPLHGSAHGFYMQLLSGKGLTGFVLFVAIQIFILVALIKQLIITRRSPDKSRFLVSLSLFSFMLAFSLYGLVQELFYIHNIEVLFFAVAAGFILSSELTVSFKPRTKIWLLCFIVVTLIAHLVSLGLTAADPLATGKSFGCYAREKQEGGKYARWCAPYSRQEYPVRKKGTQCLARVVFRTQFFGDTDRPSFLAITPDSDTGVDRPTHYFPVEQHHRYIKDVPLGEILSGETCPKKATLTLLLDNYFVPRKIFQRGDDYRILAFQLIR